MIITGSGSSCGACKFLRRKCTRECIFAPYFFYEQAATHFAAVHKVFGASNVSKLLLHLPEQCRSEAAVTISYEALARMQDPIYGCVAEIFALQQQVATLKEEIETIGNQMANLAFNLPSRESFQVTSNSNSELAFWNENVNQENCVNQHISLLPRTGNISTNQALSTHTIVQHPPISGWKDNTSHPHSNSNILETVFEELGKTGYLQIPWTESNTALN